MNEEEKAFDELERCKKLLALVWAHCTCAFDVEIEQAVVEMIEKKETDQN